MRNLAFNFNRLSPIFLYVTEFLLHFLQAKPLLLVIYKSSGAEHFKRLSFPQCRSQNIIH